MRHLTLRLGVALLAALTGVAVTTVWLARGRSVEDVPQKTQPVTLSHEEGEAHPDDTAGGWESIFFETINERAAEAGLASLRTSNKSKGDFEVRVWVGFGLSSLEGFVLKHAEGRWSATHLEGIHPRLPKREYQKVLQAPQSGWEAAWQRLVDAGILTLPDASTVRCNGGINDGMSFVVEVNREKEYRTYMYDNPHRARCDEAKRMMKVGEVIAEEFGVQEFRLGK